ncbi:hypothetical protein [Roseobacter sp.]|uniref:hypothetical protein n=1 Tax=Roseobacter sp. TaxID=1907202 RepID=UPI00329738D1
MKPNFALSLSSERIRLLHRVTQGWRIVGDVSPDALDLTAQLVALRKAGMTMAPEGMRSKVVIPNAQIRYIRVDTPGMSLADRRDAGREALVGATPYEVEDLAFDVTAHGDETIVAAVALETLEEAETFATEHGFHPVSFVATPEIAAHFGEPYFGPARSTRALLNAGQTIEPDTVGIVVDRPVARPQRPAPAASAPPVDTPPTAQAPSALNFRSARAQRQTSREAVADALARIQPADPSHVGVTDPDLPRREVTPPPGAFSSRRARPDVTYEIDAQPVPALGGFAEDAEPFEHRQPQVSAGGKRARQIEADRMTVFGARARNAAQAQQPRAPIALTGVLVVVLAGIGTLSFGRIQDTVSAWTGRAPSHPADIIAIDVSPPLEKPATLLNGASQQANLSDEDAAVLDALRTPLSDETKSAAVLNGLRANYAVTGIWPQAPDVPNPPPLVDIEDIYVTSVDPIEPEFDAVALPDFAALPRDVAYGLPGAQISTDKKFTLDHRGLVIPTAQGTLNPDGVKIFTGAPPVRPAAFPDRVGVEEKLNPIQTDYADFRPKPRPLTLIADATPAPSEELTDDEQTEQRPPVRPAQAAQAASAANGGLAPLVSPAAQSITTSNTKLALAASMRPDARPSNFGQIVARAQKTAASAAAIGAAAVAPAPVAVAPNIPTNASVTREATLRNAINLRQVNLIGVYGSSSARRALVRLTNGRYKKVQVGDRIDGGRVSAIGEAELRYQRRGRNIVLKMPRG